MPSDSLARNKQDTTSVYHVHPLVAGPLDRWAALFERVAAMGFSHLCLAPPFEPGATGDIFFHATFDNLHPALDFAGSADKGLRLAADLAARAGLKLMLDIAPGQVAIDAPLHRSHPDWFGVAGSNRIADPRRPYHQVDIAVPRFGQTTTAEAVTDWWVKILTRLMQAGIESFRCLTLDRIPAWFWGRLTAAFPDALFLAWTPGVPQLRDLAGAGFSLSVSSAAWWDGRAPWFFDEQMALRDVAPALASPEPSFLDRLVRRLAPDADLPEAYRLSLQIAAATGAGLFLPMGFEYATSRRFDSVHASPEDMEAAKREMRVDLSDDIAAAIRLNKNLPPALELRPITSPAAPVTALLRDDTLVLINPDIVRSAMLGFSVAPLPPTAGSALSAMGDLEMPLHRGEVRILKCRRESDASDPGLELCSIWAKSTRIAIEAIEPSGEFTSKTVVGRDFVISADVFGDGHDVLAADVLWRAGDTSEWRRVRMRKLPNDRWEGRIRPERIGLYQFAVEGWWDQWGTFTHDLQAKFTAGLDVTLELEEGQQLIKTAVPGLDTVMTAEAMLEDDFAALIHQSAARTFIARSSIQSLRVDRPAAEFASWYELFPRSATHDPTVPGTFRSVIERLPNIRRMGFDVLYFPPIHPIGRINRKGRNNSLMAAPGDVGSPYAIGSAEGGHDGVHHELGTLEDFRALIQAGQKNNLEVAIDFAVQCAPDHPWVAQHRDWFRWRPDGSIRYAENPPKKYEDIVNPDFYSNASFPAIWTALRDVVQFWVDQGVRIFRVDNPHTKPLPFWKWMIADIQGRHPEVLFLAEAFTRPKPMYRLAKAGFSQSYTYFTWRNTKQEITAYLTELTTPPVADFFRPNFFVNTPDINPVFLQTSGRAGFLVRAALAATLSGLWGVYSGFEICEAAALPGREEYLDAEKYEIRPRDYAMQGNIVAEITALNRIRRQHPALQSHLGLVFYNAFNDQIILYGKRDPLDHSMILVVVSLDPHIAQEAAIEVPLWEFGLPDSAAIEVTDLMRGEYFVWYGKHQYIRLDPVDLPFRVWRLEVR